MSDETRQTADPDDHAQRCDCIQCRWRKPELGSVSDVIRSRPTTRLYVPPDLWSDLHMRLLNISFVDLTPRPGSMVVPPPPPRPPRPPPPPRPTRGASFSSGVPETQSSDPESVTEPDEESNHAGPEAEPSTMSEVARGKQPVRCCWTPEPDVETDTTSEEEAVFSCGPGPDVGPSSSMSAAVTLGKQPLRCITPEPGASLDADSGELFFDSDGEPLCFYTPESFRTPSPELLPPALPETPKQEPVPDMDESMAGPSGVPRHSEKHYSPVRDPYWDSSSSSSSSSDTDPLIDLNDMLHVAPWPPMFNFNQRVNAASLCGEWRELTRRTRAVNMGSILREWGIRPIAQVDYERNPPITLWFGDKKGTELKTQQLYYRHPENPRVPSLAMIDHGPNEKIGASHKTPPVNGAQSGWGQVAGMLIALAQAVYRHQCGQTEPGSSIQVLHGRIEGQPRGYTIAVQVLDLTAARQDEPYLYTARVPVELVVQLDRPNALCLPSPPMVVTYVRIPRDDPWILLTKLAEAFKVTEFGTVPRFGNTSTHHSTPPDTITDPIIALARTMPSFRMMDMSSFVFPLPREGGPSAEGREPRAVEGEPSAGKNGRST